MNDMQDWEYKLTSVKNYDFSDVIVVLNDRYKPLPDRSRRTLPELFLECESTIQVLDVKPQCFVGLRVTIKQWRPSLVICLLIEMIKESYITFRASAMIVIISLLHY